MVVATITKKVINNADAGGGWGAHCIGVIGSRALPVDYSGKVGDIIDDLLDRGFHIASGGAVGTDEYVAFHLVHIGMAERGTIHTPWASYKKFPVKVRALTRQFKEHGGSILWGDVRGDKDYSTTRAGLLARNVRLVNACHGLVAFLYEDSRGTLFTLSRAIKLHKPIVIVPVDREVPTFSSVRWKPLLCGGCWEGAYKAVYIK